MTREACTVRTQKVLTSDAWTSATSQVPDMTMPDGATRDRDLVTHLMAYNAANMANAVQVSLLRVFTYDICLTLG